MRPVDAASVLGVPALPPPLVSEAGAKVRSVWGTAHRKMAPPPVQILEAALANLDHRVLVALCEVGLFDALRSETTVEALASDLGVNEPKFERLVRFAAAKGWLRLEKGGRVRPNRVSEFLRSDHPSGWRSWVDFVGGEEIVAAVGALDCRDADDTFAEVNGATFFEWMREHPDRWATFDAAMAAGARMHGLTLDAAIDWGDAASVCDVGGGTGETVRVLLDRHPEWRGCVLDLPEVLERAVEHPRLTPVGGDAFEAVPAGYDLYLIVNVLHDWDDDSCVRLLSNVVAAGGDRARLFVVDADRRTVPRDDLALRADVLMAALTAGGQERTADEFAAIGRRAGLRLVESSALASGDVAHEFRR